MAEETTDTVQQPASEQVMAAVHAETPAPQAATEQAAASTPQAEGGQTETSAANMQVARAFEANLKGPRLLDHMQWGWLALFVLVVCFIWGNSMRQGVDSTNLSSTALLILQGWLADFSLPFDWLTDHIVRKTAHFCEYALLGLVGMQAFTPHREKFCGLALAVFCLVIVAIPSLDETIQLFIDGRTGQVSDVLLDCCGALFGIVLTLAGSALWRRHLVKKASKTETAAEPEAPTAVAC